MNFGDDISEDPKKSRVENSFLIYMKKLRKPKDVQCEIKQS